MATRSSPGGRELALLVVATGLLMAACGDDLGDGVPGSGDIVTDSRLIAEFDRIEFAGQGDVLFGTTAGGAIEIETDDNLVGFIDTEVSEGTLTIRTRDDTNIDPTEGVVYRIGCPVLTRIDFSGAGSIDVAGCATTERLVLDMSGAGSLSARDLDLVALDIVMPGAGTIDTSGTTSRLDIELSGAGEIVASDLESVDAFVDLPGTGEVTLWATGSLDVQLSGAGSVRYFGSPSVTESISGAGSIESLGAE